MKYRCVAAPWLIIYVFIAPFGILIIPILFLLFAGNFDAVISVLLLYFSLVFVMGIILRNAFCVCSIDSTGIGNRHYKLCWEEINEISVKRILMFEYSWIPTIHLPSAICFGSAQGNVSFRGLNSKQCVFFCFSKKRLEILNLLGSGKSRQLDTFLETYCG